jgi:hypothetical protein
VAPTVALEEATGADPAGGSGGGSRTGGTGSEVGSREPGTGPESEGVARRVARFLDPLESCRHMALVSYPRSGNSLLRTLLEACSGIITGSDTPPDAPLSKDLSSFGLRGEGVVDARVWLIKSHWPERRGSHPIDAHAAVLLVRNPFDAIDSFWNMVLTSSHNHSVREAEYDRLAADWEGLVRREVAVWAAFHRCWVASMYMCMCMESSCRV